jgi:hypothetical protein
MRLLAIISSKIGVKIPFLQGGQACALFPFFVDPENYNGSNGTILAPRIISCELTL